MGAHIFTGAEAKALRDAIRHGGEPCPPDCSGECVAAYAGALMRLRDAAPDLAESVVHHAARAERAEAEAVSLRSSVTYLERQVDHEGAAQQATWRTLGGEGSAPNADAVTERATAVVGERAAALAQAEELTRALRVTQSDLARALADGRVELRQRADDAERVAADLRDDLERLRAIIEGRTTPPTDAEVCAHVAPGRSGWWLVSSPDDMSLELIEQPKERDWCIEWGATQWLPIDLDGRPCAWPVVTEAPR